MRTILFLFLAIGVFAGCTTVREPMPSPYVDIPRYMGQWYVIANIPYFGEKDCFGSFERYRLLPDGQIETHFVARKKGFYGRRFIVDSVAKVMDNRSNSDWEVKFFGGLAKTRLLILHVSPDYRYAVVATPDRKLAWIFSRERTLPARNYHTAVGFLHAAGIDTSKLQMVPQIPWA